MAEPHYIQKEPKAFPADIDWQAMSPEERGCFHSLIEYLGCNKGKLPNNPEHLRLLCNANEKQFENFWKNYFHKFQEKNEEISHKRVSQELAAARKRIRRAKLAGIASGNSRRTQVQPKFNTSSKQVEPNKVKVSKDKLSKVNNKYSPNSDEFRLSTFLLNCILKRKPDFKKPNIQSWSAHIDRMIRLDKRTAQRIEAVIRWCQQDDFWQDNILSTAKLRKQFDKLELRMKKNERQAAQTGGDRRQGKSGGQKPRKDRTFSAPPEDAIEI